MSKAWAYFIMSRDPIVRIFSAAWAGSVFVLVIISSIAALTACTQIRVTGGGRESTVYRFGVLRIVPDPHAPLLVVETSGVGLVPTVGGAAVGWTRQLTIMSSDPKRCQLVLVIHTTDELAAIKHQLQQKSGSFADLCEIDTRQGEEYESLSHGNARP